MTDNVVRMTYSQLHDDALEPVEVNGVKAYSSIALVHMTGISYRQLDYWTRTGRLHPLTDASPGSGSIRMFTEYEVDRARIMGNLIESGVSLNSAYLASLEIAARGYAELTATLVLVDVASLPPYFGRLVKRFRDLIRKDPAK